MQTLLNRAGQVTLVKQLQPQPLTQAVAASANRHCNFRWRPVPPLHCRTASPYHSMPTLRCATCQRHSMRQLPAKTTDAIGAASRAFHYQAPVDNIILRLKERPLHNRDQTAQCRLGRAHRNDLSDIAQLALPRDDYPPAITLAKNDQTGL